MSRSRSLASRESQKRLQEGAIGGPARASGGGRSKKKFEKHAKVVDPLPLDARSPPAPFARSLALPMRRAGMDEKSVNSPRGDGKGHG